MLKKILLDRTFFEIVLLVSVTTLFLLIFGMYIFDPFVMLVLYLFYMLTRYMVINNISLNRLGFFNYVYSWSLQENEYSSKKCCYYSNFYLHCDLHIYLSVFRFFLSIKYLFCNFSPFAFIVNIPVSKYLSGYSSIKSCLNGEIYKRIISKNIGWFFYRSLLIYMFEKMRTICYERFFWWRYG